MSDSTTSFRVYSPAAAALLAALLLVALLGPAAAGPVIGTVLIDLVLTSTLCIALAQATGGQTSGVWASASRSLRSALTNPLPWAIALGASAAALNLQLPGPIAQIIKMLADSASPVALFTIGAVLARSQMLAHERPHGPLRWVDYLPIAVTKLLLHPVLVLLVAGAAVQMEIGRAHV